MKTVLVQKGVEDAGKSTTIRLLYKMLTGAHPDAEISDIKLGKPPFLNKTDIRAVITIGEFRIGVESQGDPWCKLKRLDKSLAVFVELECDVIVCATRTSGGTVLGVKCLEDEGYQIVWRDRPREDTPAAGAETNRREARWMFDQIEDMLSPAAV